MFILGCVYTIIGPLHTIQRECSFIDMPELHKSQHHDVCNKQPVWHRVDQEFPNFPWRGGTFYFLDDFKISVRLEQVAGAESQS